MDTKQHPITPPPELVQQWLQEHYGALSKCAVTPPSESAFYLTTQAARWGADQELEACRLWVSEVHSIYDAAELLNQRRPKPPSLKEQALAALDNAVMRGDCITISDALPTIRRALEQLND